MKEKKGWIPTETMAVKRLHYFIEGEESLCGKIFNTDKKVKGNLLIKCEKCLTILKETKFKEPEEIIV